MEVGFTPGFSPSAVRQVVQTSAGRTNTDIEVPSEAGVSMVLLDFGPGFAGLYWDVGWAQDLGRSDQLECLARRLGNERPRRWEKPMGITPETWPQPLRDLVRASNKHLLNPLMLRLAGRRYWYASLLQHTGRRSGRRYATPVVADHVGTDVLVPLPYGTHVDWLKNVMTAGQATLISGGRTYELTAPEIIDATEALPLLPKDRRRVFERTGMARFLRARAVHERDRDGA